jgi:hypothetical protein
MLDKFISEIIKGAFIGLLYLQTTLTNDTTIENIIRFTFFYLVMVYGAMISGIQATAITGAFLTKTVFTLIDERVVKKTPDENSKILKLM